LHANSRKNRQISCLYAQKPSVKHPVKNSSSQSLKENLKSFGESVLSQENQEKFQVKLSVIIPARNEENCVKKTVDELNKRLEKEHLDFEILVINDHSNDKTENILKELQENNQNFRFLNNAFPEGFGWAVRYGLEYFKGDAIAVYMADASDSPDDLVRFFKKFQTGYDCVFGSRFIRGGTVRDYPLLKLILNRMANFFIKTVFMIN
jgi:dolichol-phosphate mannosyltransferase